MPKKLMRGIRHFKNHLFEEKQDVFRALSQGQAPDVLFITCSDSRIEPKLFTHADLGELFVLRNAGNIIAPASNIASGEAATIEFALEALCIQDIVICGHSHCGAMKGLLKNDIEKTLPQTNAWLCHAKKALERLHEHSGELTNQSMALTCLTQENIILQIEHLKTHAVVKRKLAEGKLKIHGWYYEFENGEIYLYNEIKQKFISFEQTIFDLSQKILSNIIDNEALNYIKATYSEKDQKSQAQLKKLVQHIKKSNSISEIWPHIKANVRQQLQGEIIGLFKTADEANTQVAALLDTVATIPLQQFCDLNKVINKLLFQFHLYDARQQLFSKSEQKSSEKEMVRPLNSHL